MDNFLALLSNQVPSLCPPVARLENVFDFCNDLISMVVMVDPAKVVMYSQSPAVLCIIINLHHSSLDNTVTVTVGSHHRTLCLHVLLLCTLYKWLCTVYIIYIYMCVHCVPAECIPGTVELTTLLSFARRKPSSLKPLFTLLSELNMGAVGSSRLRALGSTGSSAFWLSSVGCDVSTKGLSINLSIHRE